MFRLFILFSGIFFCYIEAADNNTLLNEQLEAINRQLSNSQSESGSLDPKDDSEYQYNQNTIYKEEPKRAERFYVGASRFIGYFITESDNEAYNIRESIAFSYLRVGYIFKTNNRIELNFIQEAELPYKTFEHSTSGVNLNAIIPIALNKEQTTHLKFSGGVGVYKYSDFSLEGGSLNTGIGAIYDITRDIEIDLTYGYQVILWKDFDNLSSSSEIKTTIFKGLHVGAKYKF